MSTHERSSVQKAQTVEEIFGKFDLRRKSLRLNFTGPFDSIYFRKSLQRSRHKKWRHWSAADLRLLGQPTLVVQQKIQLNLRASFPRLFVFFFEAEIFFCLFNDKNIFKEQTRLFVQTQICWQLTLPLIISPYCLRTFQEIFPENFLKIAAKNVPEKCHQQLFSKKLNFLEKITSYWQVGKRNVPFSRQFAFTSATFVQQNSWLLFMLGWNKAWNCVRKEVSSKLFRLAT